MIEGDDAYIDRRETIRKRERCRLRMALMPFSRVTRKIRYGRHYKKLPIKFVIMDVNSQGETHG